jgi:hypothetical protein
MTGHETHYWQGTESDLLGSFEIQGSCTSGDGSCDTDSKSMGSGFCNFFRLGWNSQTPLPPSSIQSQHTLNSRKVGRENEGISSTRPELVVLTECLEDHETMSVYYTLLTPKKSYKLFTDGSDVNRNSVSPNHPIRTSSRKS